jgi:hypothetical protein
MSDTQNSLPERNLVEQLVINYNTNYLSMVDAQIRKYMNDKGISTEDLAKGAQRYHLPSDNTEIYKYHDEVMFVVKHNLGFQIFEPSDIANADTKIEVEPEQPKTKILKG